MLRGPEDITMDLRIKDMTVQEKSAHRGLQQPRMDGIMCLLRAWVFLYPRVPAHL
jgi:hypothetical protein